MFHDGIDLDTSCEVRSFLMIGQSNMAGRGALEDVPPIENKNCLMLRMGRWQRMREPINPDRSMHAGKYPSGVSLAASFADCVANDQQALVGLIPCADGGTCIDQWMPGSLLFDHAVMMTRLAMRTSKLSGILWHQGESDCTSEERFLAHGEKFVTMITALRQELGAQDLPLLIGEVCETLADTERFDDRPARMNESYRRIAESLPRCGVVSAKGLGLKPDGLHFNSAALREFGVRYFNVYQDLI